MSPPQLKTYVLERALLPCGWCGDVRVAVNDGGNIVTVEPGAGNGDAAEERVVGHVVPGVPNAHSHAHQRALAGRTERAGPVDDSFWTWRDAMYRLAAELGPDELKCIATRLYVEMLEAGYTSVGEFHYLHHRPDGAPYRQAAALSLTLLEAAEEAGMGITMLPALYASGGFGGAPASEGQKRFVNDGGRFLALIETVAQACEGRGDRRFGIAPHSLRAVPMPVLRDVLEGLDAIDAGAPVHLHIAEQAREVDECMASTGGLRPVAWLLSELDVNERWCLVHATHVTGEETAAIAASGAVVALCPTTEANLGDGVFPARDYLAAGGRISIGSDSQVGLCPAGELRLLEYTQRLAHRARNVLAGGPGRSTGRALMDAVLAGGAQCLGRAIGAIAPGMRADFVVLDARDARLVGLDGDDVLDAWVFAGDACCVRDVYVGGRRVVRDGRHERSAETLERYGSLVSSSNSSLRIRSMIGTTSAMTGPLRRNTSPPKSTT